MSQVVPTISGPKRPQDKVLLTEAAENFKKVFKEASKRNKPVVSKIDDENLKLKMEIF